MITKIMKITIAISSPMAIKISLINHILQLSEEHMVTLATNNENNHSNLAQLLYSRQLGGNVMLQLAIIERSLHGEISWLSLPYSSYLEIK
jgi:hypothetical protein